MADKPIEIQLSVNIDFVRLVERYREAEQLFEKSGQTTDLDRVKILRFEVDDYIRRFYDSLARLGLFLPSRRESED
jgi:hypothetical protein